MEQGPGHATPPPEEPTSPPRPGRGRRIGELTIVALLAAALAAGGTWGVVAVTDAPEGGTPGTTASTSGTADAEQASQSEGQAPDWNAVTDDVTPSAVAITVGSGSSGGQGSGVIIDEQGHVLTNHHVVAGAGDDPTIRVSLDDGSIYRATVAGTDPSTDLAVVTLEDPPDDLEPIEVGSSTKLEVGDPVMAVGNPLGLAGTVTTGIVSALNRPVTTSTSEGGGGEPPFAPPQQDSEPVVTSAIQTSAAINPGNSGGALVDASGRLVGINSSIASLGGSSGSSGNIGIGFAIPSQQATWIADQLIEDGDAQHAFLGVRPTNGTAERGSARLTGAELSGVVDGGPAEEAGLERGDLVVSVDDVPVRSAESLVGLVHARKIDSTVSITLIRDGEEETVEATLGTAPSDRG